MAHDALPLRRPRLLSPDGLARICATAADILARHGLAVHHPEAREAAARAGLRVLGERVFPDRATAAQLIAETREAGLRSLRPDPSADQPFIALTCQYATHVHDLDSDRVVPFTTERLTEAAKLVGSLHADGVRGAAPGCPSDVPAPLQPLLQYRIGAQHCPDGRHPVDPKWAASVPYVMDMAEVLGSPLRSLPVYVVSPLTLGAESLACAIGQRHRLSRLHVGNMSSAGASAPIRLAHALALGVAEVVGGALVLQAATGLPVDWGVRVVAFDLRGMAMSFGGPEDLLFRWACEELNAFCHGREPGPPGGVLRTQAKVPGPQAAAEKMAGIVSGALLGSRHYDGAGALSLDEVFSAEQLLFDCELLDYGRRLAAGADVSLDPASCLEEIGDGLGRGFLASDATLDQYRRLYWLPRFLERRSLPAWLEAGSSDLRRRIHQLARERIAGHDYQLEPTLARELERIYARAERDLAGG